MKKYIFIWGVILMAMFSSNALAQNNWFVRVGFGVDYYEGDDDNLCIFSDRPSYYYSVTAGKWLSPLWGVQLTGSYGILKGGALENNTPYSIGSELHWASGYSHDTKGYFEKFNHFTIQPEAVLNLSNAITEVIPQRRWNLLAHAGIGYSHSSSDSKCPKSSSAGSMNLTCGVTGMVRVYRNVSAFIDARYTLLTNKEFDGDSKDGKLDDMGALSVGLNLDF